MTHGKFPKSSLTEGTSKLLKQGDLLAKFPVLTYSLFRQLEKSEPRFRGMILYQYVIPAGAIPERIGNSRMTPLPYPFVLNVATA